MFYTSLVTVFATLAFADVSLKKDLLVKWALSLTCFFLLLLTAGLRWKTGNDWTAYYNFYQFANDMSYQSLSFEWGYRALVQGCKALGLSYTGFLLVVSSIQLIGFLRLFSLFTYPAVLFFIFLTTYFFGYMGTLRQSMAVSLCLAGFVSLYRKEYWKFYLWVLAGSLFHISAVIFLAARLVPARLVQPWVYAALTGAAIFTGYGLIPLMLNVLSGLNDSFFVLQKVIDYSTTKSDLGDQTSLSITWYIKRLGFVAIFYWVARSTKKRLYETAFNLYFCSFLIFIVFFNLIPMIALRGGEYYGIFEVVLLGALFMSVKDFNLRVVLFVCLIVLSGLRLHNSLNAYHPELYFPYYSVFEKYEASRFMH